jgi:hypothetical protein
MLIKKKNFFTTQCTGENLYPGIYFLGAICHLGMFICLKSVKQSVSFDTHEVQIARKIVGPLYI